MLEDVKIHITDKESIDDVLYHAMDLGFVVDGSTLFYIRKADYLLLDPNQAVRWCEEPVFITALSYKELTQAEFMSYQGEDYE